MPSYRSLLVRLLPVVVPLLLWRCRVGGEPADTERADTGADANVPIPPVSSPDLEVTDAELRLHTGDAPPLRVGLDGSAGGARFVAAALRPGSTEESATVVAIVATDDAYALPSPGRARAIRAGLPTSPDRQDPGRAS